MIHKQIYKLKHLSVFLLLAAMSASCLGQPARQAKDLKQVQVASHRGDWRNYADNSIEGVESCIRMGVDIVELDVARTKDGHLILMHDKTVNRTTNGKGKVDSLSLAEIKEMYLRNGLGRVTDFKVPTLEEAMLTAKGRIKVNLDKADEYFDQVYAILLKTGTVEQAIIKSDKPYHKLKALYGDNLDKMVFMPVVNLSDTISLTYLDSLLEKKYPYYELVFKGEDKKLLSHIREKLSGTNSVIWVNSLWDSLCAGYSDDKALSDPNATWGYLIDSLGAGILQTDRPALMIEYLKERGLHD